jgi:hypothetical protein
VQERLIDWGNKLLYGYPILPADLSTTANFQCRVTGLHVPLHVLLSFRTEEGRRALLNCAKDVPWGLLKSTLTSYTRGVSELKENVSMLLDIMTRNGLKPPSMRPYWQQPARRQKYGTFTTMYALMVERFMVSYDEDFSTRRK